MTSLPVGLRWPGAGGPRLPRGLPARLRAGRGGLTVMALAVGAGAGLGAVAFRWLIATATQLFTGTQDYAGTHGHPAHPWVTWLGPWFVVLAPAVGGLLYGPLVQRFAREARGHGVPEVMYAVAARGGRIAGRVAVVKALASAICIGSGGSVGREGPIVQIGSALGSTLGRVARVAGVAAAHPGRLRRRGRHRRHLQRPDRRGVLRPRTAAARLRRRGVRGGRALRGDGLGDRPGGLRRAAPSCTCRPSRCPSPVEYLLYALLGLLAGVVGVGFTRVLYAVEDACDWAWRGPEWARPAVGGLAARSWSCWCCRRCTAWATRCCRAGSRASTRSGFLLVLLVGKMLATSLTIGIGGSGGVFAPSLFIGAMLGAAFGDVVHAMIPHGSGPAGAYALVGMGAVFAGAARAPITAVLIMFELTGEYTIILPLMLAIVVGGRISHWLTGDTIYTLKLRRRGVNLDVQAGDPRLRAGHVHEVMQPAPAPLPGDLPLAAAAEALMSGGYPALPVVRGDELLGVVTARAVSEALANDDDADTATIARLAQLPDAVHPDTTLTDALITLVSSDATGVPVIDGDGRVTGWLTHQALLRAVAPSGTSGAAPTPAAGQQHPPGQHPREQEQAQLIAAPTTPDTTPAGSG